MFQKRGPWAARGDTRSWVGVRRLFHRSVFLTASRTVLPQDPSTDSLGGLAARDGEEAGEAAAADAGVVKGATAGRGGAADTFLSAANQAEFCARVWAPLMAAAGIVDGPRRPRSHMHAPAPQTFYLRPRLSLHILSSNGLCA